VPTQFTIAIPTHDRRETVLLAARSALEQTRSPQQVLVLCDGCTDGTADALRGLGSSCLEALELPKASGYGYEHRNRSLEVAIGEAILWLGDDDLLMPDHLERIGELWDTGGFDLVQSNGVAVAPDDTLEWFAPDWSLPVNRVRLARGNTNPMSSVSLRVDLASAIGGWNAELPRAADWDLWQRALAAGARSARSPEPTVLHFHASDRDQAWPLRVRQNEAWLDRLGDPDRLSELRIALRLVEAERASRIEQYAAEVEQYANDLRHTLDAARLETLEVREHAARIDAQRAGAEATLARIYTGGWWRLRSKLLPLLKRLGHEG
jgi:glycosyltransferase involved in cell wall biosynthesis